MKKLGFGVLAAAVVLAGCAVQSEGDALGRSRSALTWNASLNGTMEFVPNSVVLTGTTLAFQVRINKATYKSEFLAGPGQDDASIVVNLGDACAAPVSLVQAATQHASVVCDPGSGNSGNCVWSGAIDVSNCGGATLYVTHHCSNGCAWDSCEVEGTGSLTTTLELWSNNSAGNSRCTDTTGAVACQVLSDLVVSGSGTGGVSGIDEQWVGHWGSNVLNDDTSVCGYANPNAQDNGECPGNNETSPSCDGLWPVQQ